MIPMQTCQARLPQQMTVKIFPTWGQFLLKLEKHILSDREPWERVFGAKILRQMGKKLPLDDVSAQEDLYQRTVEIVEEGIRFAESEPLFLRVKQRVETDSGKQFYLGTVYLLSKKGFRIVIHGGAVRTMYFVNFHPNESNHALFHRTWRAIKVKGMKTKYRDHETSSTIYQSRVRWFSTANWQKCPNPYPRPPRDRSSIPQRHSNWLDELEASLRSE